MRKACKVGIFLLCALLLLVGCGPKEGSSSGVELDPFVQTINAKVNQPLILDRGSRKENQLGYYYMPIPSEKIYVEVVNYKKSETVYYYNVVIRHEYKDDPEAWAQMQEYAKAGIAAGLPGGGVEDVIEQLNLNAASRAEATALNKQNEVRVGEATFFMRDYSDNANGMVLCGYEFDNPLSQRQSQGQQQAPDLG